MVNINTIKGSLIKRIAPSILLMLIIIASLTGGTYAWFIAGSISETEFTAGTVKVTDPVIDEVKTETEGSSNKFAFIPNSGEASVSKVDLERHVEIARYYTAPRLGDEIVHDDNSTSTNDIDPQDWRTSRIAQDEEGNVWVLNVGSDGNNLQGSVVRIQAETEGLTTNNNPDNPLPFGQDEAVQVFPVGVFEEMPRAIAIDGNGYIWVGFYGSGRLAQYNYDPFGPSLDFVDNWMDEGIGFYEMKFAPDGKLFISSRQSVSTPSRLNNISINTGIYTFDNNIFEKETDWNPYSILIADDGTVYTTAYSNQLYIRDKDTEEWSYVIITGSSQNRGMAFDGLGNIWIASTVGTIGGNTIYSYNIDNSVPGPTYTLTRGTTPVGIGRDEDGTMWAVCRTDGSAQGFIEGFNPANQEKVGYIEVGYRPYAYGDFSKVDSTCKTIKWEFEIEESKKVHVRVKPFAKLDGDPGKLVVITLCSGQDSWVKAGDWYYLEDENRKPKVLAPNEKVEICFRYCFAAETDLNLIVELEVQAVQHSNNAIDYEWSSHPWN